MEIVKTLKKQRNIRNTRRSISKLKVDLTNKTYITLRKISNFMGKDVKDMDLNEDLSFMRFNNFHVEVIKLNPINIDINSKSIEWIKHKLNVNEDKEFILYRVTIDDPYMQEDPAVIYTSNYKIPTSFITKNYRFNGNIYRFLDIGYLYGMLKTLDVVFGEVAASKNIYLSKEFKGVYKDEVYREDEFKSILSMPFKTSFTLFRVMGKQFKDYEKTSHLIVDVILRMKLNDSNIELSEKYNTQIHSECARAFETKKNIPDKILRIMDKTSFLKWFSYVEIDEDTDLALYKKIENEWIRVKNALTLDKFLNIKPELRFRKLGKHRASGLYYPSLKCICVDINTPSSFLHEFGHFIDFTYGSNQLSLESNFFYIIQEYRKAFEQTLLDKEAAGEDSNVINYIKRKKGYYFTPTEIFARCFEIFLMKNGVRTSFLSSNKKITFKLGYPEVSKEFMSLINEYYFHLISINLSELEDPNIRQVSLVQECKSNVNVKYIPPIINRSGQLEFAI